MRRCPRKASSRSISSPGSWASTPKVVRKRASVITLADGVTVRLLHPPDVLECRLSNLDALPFKRNAVRVAQARLAVSVVRAFIENHMDSGGDPRTVRQAVKRVEKLALDTRLSQAAFTFDINVLGATPVERIGYPRFHKMQWPRVLARLNRKREKFVALQVRRKAAPAKWMQLASDVDARARSGASSCVTLAPPRCTASRRGRRMSSNRGTAGMVSVYPTE